MLRKKFRAKVANFGFSHLAPIDIGATHVSTQVKETIGYIDLEYLKTYQVTHKSDVYSFNVFLVEIITGRWPIEKKREHRERITAHRVSQNTSYSNHFCSIHCLAWISIILDINSHSYIF